jgi:hypothetical protein
MKMEMKSMLEDRNKYNNRLNNKIREANNLSNYRQKDKQKMMMMTMRRRQSQVHTIQQTMLICRCQVK